MDHETRDKLDPLQELVRDKLGGTAYRIAAERARGLVSPTTLWRIMAGETQNLHDRTIAGLALALHCTETQVRAAYEQAQRRCPTCGRVFQTR